MKKLFATMLVVMMLLMMALPVYAAAEEPAEAAVEVEEETAVDGETQLKSSKAWSAALVVGATAAAGAIGMALAISKSVDGIARQPEAEGKIRTTMMLGLIFVETAIIYALVVGILIIFVL